MLVVAPGCSWKCRGSAGCCGWPRPEMRRELGRKRSFPHPTLIVGACLSLADLRDLGVDPRRCYLRLLAAAAGMGDVRVPHLLPHLPAAPLKLPPRLPQEQRELESAGKEGKEHGQMLAGVVWAMGPRHGDPSALSSFCLDWKVQGSSAVKPLPGRVQSQPYPGMCPPLGHSRVPCFAGQFVPWRHSHSVHERRCPAGQRDHQL